MDRTVYDYEIRDQEQRVCPLPAPTKPARQHCEKSETSEHEHQTHLQQQKRIRCNYREEKGSVYKIVVDTCLKTSLETRGKLIVEWQKKKIKMIWWRESVN